jgi:hypothetical protein
MLLDEIDGFRSIARGFSAAVGLATREGDFDQAAAIALDSIRFGFNIGRGGLLIDTLVGYACASYGYFDLFELRKQLSPEICLQIAGHLRAIESSLEPMEDISYRDKVWTQRVFGWGAHLIQIIQDTGLPMESNWITDAWDSYDEISDRNRAVLRLLEMHFALRVWHAQFDDWPASLDLLVPEYLPTVPLDPLSTEGKPLQYRLTDDGYLLYSVGMNRTDEGGLPPDDDGNGDSDPSTGDLMLEHLYAPPAVEPAEGEAEEGE